MRTTRPQWERVPGRCGFYVFSLEEPLTSRLEQFDITSKELPLESLASLQAALQARVTSRYGRAEDRSPSTGRAVLWPEDLRWTTPDLQVELNLSEFDRQRNQGRLLLQARHRTLLEALKDDERLEGIGSYVLAYAQAGTEIDRQLAAALQSDFPVAATMLLKDRPDPDPQQTREAVQKALNELRSRALQQPGATSQNKFRVAVFAAPQVHWKAEEFHGALIGLLTTAKTSSPDRRPILLLAADHLAGRLPGVIFNDKGGNWDWSAWQRELKAFGVEYSAEPQQAWSYDNSLLSRVSTEYGDTAWGEQAFVSLLRRGWETRSGCVAGSDQFREVIKRGVPFLQKHANSAYRSDVQLALAQMQRHFWVDILPKGRV